VPQDVFPRLRVTTVECADTDGEDEVVWGFAGFEDEVLSGDLANAQAAGGDLIGSGESGLGNGRRRSIDGEDMTRA
jgi:hypothetical protein